MPGKQLNANVWFYQDFMSARLGKEFWPNRPEDWSRLRIWDGNTLNPAMEQGFRGQPTPEQVVKLYEQAQQGKLFYFELGKTVPRRIGLEKQDYINMNPQPPQPPVKPDVDENDSLMVSYQVHLTVYHEQMADFEKSLEEVKALGTNFWGAANTYNKSRDLQWESAEVQARNLNDGHVKNLRNRDKADRVLDQVFGPKPEAAPDIFYKPGHQSKESVIKYDLFEEQFAANAYELPPDSKLTAQDVATINFAMLGAKEPVIKVCQEKLHTGPLNSKHMATIDFQMLTTGLFGESRTNQPIVDEKVVGDVLKISKDAIEQYNQNNPAVLGKYLGECVRTVKDYFVSSSQDSFTQDLVAGTRLIERLEDLFNRNPELLEAAGLSDNEKEFMRGYSQMGKVYDNYLHSQIKLNDAAAHGKQLTTEEKARILTDAVIRRMVEMELTKDRQRVENSDEYKQNREEADERDLAIEEAYQNWRDNEMVKLPLDQQGDAQEAYIRQSDYYMNRAFAVSVPVDHAIIQKLAQPGMLENLRNRLQKDPWILAEAQKEPMDIDHKKMSQSDALDKLADYAAVNDVQKQAWFRNMKGMVTAEQEGQDLNAISPWLSAGVATDISRLKIAVPNDKGGKDLVNLESLLDGGLQELENPSQKTLDLMYRNAMDGNLYYYQVGKDMPQRLTADGEQAAAQQLKKPVEPKLWQKIINTLTLGYFFDDICHPQPDRDPAAMKSILDHRNDRNVIIADEVQAHRRMQERNPAAVEQERRNYEDRIKEDVDKFRRIPDANARREFPGYEMDAVVKKLKNDIHGSLGYELGTEKSMTENYIISRLQSDNLTPDMCREAMAALVLMEGIKMEYLTGVGNDLAAQFNDNHKGMVQGMVRNEIFRSFTKDASPEMLKHFIMVGGARNMYQSMQEIAANRAEQQPENDANVMQMEKQAGRQNGGPG